MNRGVYRLVFNAVRGIWMAVAEIVSGVGKSASGETRRLRRRLKPTILAGLVLTQPLLPALADPLLPVDTIPTGLGVVEGSAVINAPVVNPANTAGQLLDIDQSSVKAILEGTNFNIGGASAVNIDHLGGSGSATLIRINGERSIIEGALTAKNGDIYLINQNGILFANGARVDVHGLVASALNLPNEIFMRADGHLGAAYTWEQGANGFKSVLVQVDPDARIKAGLGGSVMLFAPKVINQGSIDTTEGQVVMAAGAKVYLSYVPDPNGFKLNSEDSNTYNYAPDSPYRAMRGILVEVDNYQKQGSDSPETPDEIAGQVVNDTMGRILAQRGNVTMAAFMVNQEGRVAATSSFAQKGSIRLLAREGKTTPTREFVYSDQDGSARDVTGTTNTLISASNTGQLVLGANSITTILPEDPAALPKLNEVLNTAQVGEPAAQAGELSFLARLRQAVATEHDGISDDQVFNRPTLEAEGHQIYVQDGAKLVVPAGYINLTAKANESAFRTIEDSVLVNPNLDASSRIYLGKNTLLDASGLKNVAVDMERNFVERLLTKTDLKDDPLNRDGFLYRKKVWFDIRNAPDDKVADLDGFIAQVPRSLGERSAEGGTVKLVSQGEVVQNTGSKIDVSAGSLKFGAGINKETWLRGADGKAYALGDAPTDMIFTGFVGGSNTGARMEAGYTEGKTAGAVEIKSYHMALDGSLIGGASYGHHQRESGNLGGSLTISLLAPAVEDPTNRLAAHDILIGSGASLPTDFASDDVLPTERIDTLTINAGMLNRSGFENIRIENQFLSNGSLTVTAPLSLRQGSTLSLQSNTVEIAKDITARAGKIEVEAQSFTLKQGATLDVSGNWVNDYNQSRLSGRVLTEGGSVTITSPAASNLAVGVVSPYSRLRLEKGSLIDVSGGGWVSTEATLEAGNAGSISLTGNYTPNGAFVGSVSVPELAGELRGFALGQGGSLTLEAPFITLGNTALGEANELWLAPAFFTNAGFSRFNLIGNDGVLVRSGANIDVVAQNYKLSGNYLTQATGAHVHDFASRTLLPDYLRTSTQISLATEGGDTTAVLDGFGIRRGSIVVEEGSRIRVDANHASAHGDGSNDPKITLSAWDNQLFVDGLLQAKGGQIRLNMLGSPDTSDRETLGFNSRQAIWLGEHAVLDASGYARLQPNASGLRAGLVVDGGAVELNAVKGYIVSEKESLINVAGTAQVLDIRNTRGITPTRISSNGGEVDLTAREGMLLDGEYRAGSPGGLAGSFELTLGRSGGASPHRAAENPYPGDPGDGSGLETYLPDQLWQVVLRQSGDIVPSTLALGDDVQALSGGRALLTADALMAGGFSGVSLKGEHGVHFEEDVALDMSRYIHLDARSISASAGAEVALQAAQVALSNDVENLNRGAYTALTPTAGTADLRVKAKLVDIKGQLSLSGFASSTFEASGDIRLIGVSPPREGTDALSAPIGKLMTTGQLEMQANRIYPTSFSAFTIDVLGVGGQVSFNGNGSPAAGLLSAGGALTVNAETINQNGTLMAPFGTIALNASQQLNLNAGSTTSVSANNTLIPFGKTDRSGLDYLYAFTSRGESNTQLFDLPPERRISLSAPSLNLATGSVVDVSGGGDLLAYEWIPGLGGSKDVLANGADQRAFDDHAMNTWAILPAQKGAYGSYDNQYWLGSDIEAGDAVYLSGVAGLAAGYYTLLPARYALLPGARLVTAVSGYEDRTSGQVQTMEHGGQLVSGYLAAYTDDGYVQTSRAGGFVVRDGSKAQDLAEYSLTKASTFFANETQAQLPQDAGRVSLSATDSLVLQGVLKALHADQAAGAEVDIAAPRLLIVGEGDSTGVVTLDGKNYLALSEKLLNNYGAGSLMLGGTRKNNQVSVVSSEVRMNGNANLVGPELLLAATDLVRLESGASVSGQGSGASAKDLTLGEVGTVDGDGSLLRVSSAGAATITRLNTDGDRGDFVLESGAQMQGDGAVQLNATRNISMQGDVNFAEGAALGFNAGRISLGQPADGELVTDGLWFRKEQLDKFVDAGSLLLNSRSTVDIYGDLTFGNAQLNLTVQSAGLAGYQNTGKTAQITAASVLLENPNGSPFALAGALSGATTPTLGEGTLKINTANLSVGNGQQRLAGFDQVEITASREVRLTGTAASDGSASVLATDRAMTISTARLAADAGTNAELRATDGLLSLQGTIGAQPTDLAASAALGAKLKLQGDGVVIAGGTTDISNTTDRQAARLDLAGASLTLQAAGLSTDSHNDVSIGSGAKVDLSGRLLTIEGQTRALPAGSLTMVSDNGDIGVAENALIDLRAANGGAAGKLTLTATEGSVDVTGNVLAANVGARALDAKVLVDAASIADFSKLLTQFDSFAGAQTYRLRTGNLALGADDTVTAQQVRLEVDAGSLTLNSKIDASGQKGGVIELHARDDISLGHGTELLAKGTADTQTTAGSVGNGGEVLIASRQGRIQAETADAGSLKAALIDVSGDQVGSVKGEGGEVLLSAERIGTTDVKIDSDVTGVITGAKDVYVSPVKAYSMTTLDSAAQSTIASETNSFVTTFAPALANFALSKDGLAAKVLAGVDVYSTSDLTVSDWALGNSSVASPVFTSGALLSLRAAGNVNLGNLDYEQYRLTGSALTLRNSTMSYRVVAGADDDAANLERTRNDLADSTGNIIVADNKVVRTGTGFIHMSAGNDIRLGSAGSNGAAVYTQGLPDITSPTGFQALNTVNRTVNRETYGDGGGNVWLTAGDDVTGSASASVNIKNWLAHSSRQSTTTPLLNPQIRWWALNNLSGATVVSGGVVKTAFLNGVATLGGGDISIDAGNSVSNMQVASASNGRMGGATSSAPSDENFVTLAGGDTTVSAGQDISTVWLTNGHGDFNVQAGGDVRDAQLALMVGKMTINAVGDVALTQATNPTAIASAAGSIGGNRTKFFSYDSNSALALTSLTGDVTTTNLGFSSDVTSVLPPQLSLFAATGNIDMNGAFVYPDATADLRVLAGNDVNLDAVVLYDLDPVLDLPNRLTPNLSNQLFNSVVEKRLYDGGAGGFAHEKNHSSALLYQNNLNPLTIVAGNDVIFTQREQLVSPKQVLIRAGRDIVDPGFVVQNNSANDISLVQAGRDIRYSEPERRGTLLLANVNSMQIAGPGRLHLVAGRHVDLGTSNGLRSVGALYNTALPEQGADLMVMPGAGAARSASGQMDYAAMIAAYLEPGAAGASIYLPQLRTWMIARTGDNSLTNSTALAAFKLLTAEQKAPFINQVFFAELKADGRDAIRTGSATFGDYSRAERAILRMFPDFTKDKTLVAKSGSIMETFGKLQAESAPHPGDLSLFYSQIKSERGGKIELLVPGGYVNAGLPVSGGLAKPDTDLGIVSLRGGELQGFVRDDFQVNQSRVFTLGGSDLLLYSALADIDAGKGAKTASSTPPPVIRIVNGQVVYDYSASVSGSGIAALTSTGGSPGTVDLYAPYGEINAGEAGIRSAGNINLGAERVIGADNIVAGGATTGAPAVSTSSLALATPSAAGDAVAKSASEQSSESNNNQQSESKKAPVPSFITVEVLSLGDGAPSAAPDAQRKSNKNDDEKRKN